MNLQINIYYFFVSLYIGIYLIYISTPKPKVVLQYSEQFNNSSNNNKYNIEKIISS